MEKGTRIQEYQNSTNDLAGRYFGWSELRYRGCWGEPTLKHHHAMNARGGAPHVIITTVRAWIGLRLNPNGKCWPKRLCRVTGSPGFLQGCATYLLPKLQDNEIYEMVLMEEEEVEM